jgi:uncharacterized protein with HEPN domain
MPRDLRAYLWDIQQASNEILLFTHDKTFADYERELMVQAAVERKFEIIGEALAQIAQQFPGDIGQITQHRRFIGFRNILIHRYASVAHEIVWGTIENDLPGLISQIASLIDQAEVKSPNSSTLSL